MEIQINNRQRSDRPGRDREICRRITKSLGTSKGEVSLLLVEDREMAEYNRRYLGRQGPTNVLAFPMQEGPFPEINPHLWGDVVISTETAGREAREAE